MSTFSRRGSLFGLHNLRFRRRPRFRQTPRPIHLARTSNISRFKSFLGFVNFYGYYIAGSTRLTAPLYALTAGRKSTEKVVLAADKLVAFNGLEQALVAGY